MDVLELTKSRREKWTAVVWHGLRFLSHSWADHLLLQVWSWHRSWKTMRFQRTLVDNIGWFQATCQRFLLDSMFKKSKGGIRNIAQWKMKDYYTKMTAIKIQVGSLQVFTNWTFTDIVFFMFFFLPCHLIRPLWSEKLVGSSVGSSVIGNPIARSIGTATGHAGSSEFLVPMDQHASWRIWCVFLDHPCDQRFS